MSRKIILFALFISFGLNEIYISGQLAPSGLPFSSRSFAMGLVPIPSQPLTTQNWLAAFDTLEKNTDYIMHHAPVDWKNSLNDFRQSSKSAPLKELEFITGMAKRSGLKLFLVIDPLSHNREAIDPNLPGSFGKNFGAPKVRQAFQNYTRKVVRDYRPHILSLGSEINTYLLNHPGDLKNLLSLLQETYDLIKTKTPNVIITISFQYESLQGLTGPNRGWEIFEKYEPHLDAVAITTYPSPWFTAPDQMPDDYYAALKKHTRKPLIIAESGWPSGGAKNYHGSPENQNQFLKRIVTLTQGLELKLWIWWFFHDWKGAGYPEFFKTMGLKESNGKDKPAWLTWREIYRAPVKERLENDKKNIESSIRLIHSH